MNTVSNDIDSYVKVGGLKQLPKSPIEKVDSVLATEKDIDDLLAMPSKVRHSLSDLTTQISHIKETSASPIKRADSLGSVYEARFQYQTIPRQSRTSALKVTINTDTSEQSIQKQKESIVVNLDCQDIDTLLRISNVKPAEETHRNTAFLPSNTSLDHEVTTNNTTTVSISTDATSVAESDSPLIKKHGVQTIVFKSGENRSLALGNKGTDIDSITTNFDESDIQSSSNTTARKHSGSFSLGKTTDKKEAGVKSPKETRPRANTLRGFFSGGPKSPKSPLPDMIVLALDRDLKLSEHRKSTDIDDLCAISQSQNLNPNNLPGHVTCAVENVERPKAGHIDADFLFEIAKQSENGSKEYRALLESPEHRVTASSALQNVENASDKGSNDFESSNNLNAALSLRALFREAESEPFIAANVDIDSLLEYGHTLRSSDKLSAQRRSNRAMSELPPRPTFLQDRVSNSDKEISASKRFESQRRSVHAARSSEIFPL